jgi:hypothetical protein
MKLHIKENLIWEVAIISVKYFTCLVSVIFNMMNENGAVWEDKDTLQHITYYAWIKQDFLKRSTQEGHVLNYKCKWFHFIPMKAVIYSCSWSETMSLNCGHHTVHPHGDIWAWRAMVEWQWQEETEELGENLSQCQFVHHKSHTEWPRCRNVLAKTFEKVELCHCLLITHRSLLSPVNSNDDSPLCAALLLLFISLLFLQVKIAVPDKQLFYQPPYSSVPLTSVKHESSVLYTHHHHTHTHTHTHTRTHARTHARTHTHKYYNTSINPVQISMGNVGG